MQSLAFRGTRHLTLEFSEEVDWRTMEKLLTTAGIKLGSAPSSRFPESNVIFRMESVPLEILELVIPQSWRNNELLLRTVSMALPRFRALHTLRFSTNAESPAVPSCSTSPAALGITDLESAFLENWADQCAMLRTVVCPSGGEWRRE